MKKYLHKRAKKKEDIRVKLLLLFWIAQFFALAGMVGGIIFFVLIALKVIQ